MSTFVAMLITASAAIIFVLGLVHLVYTFVGNRFEPRDAELLESMKNVSPVITRSTTMWKAWLGFNASHSYGAILFGVVYGYLAIAHAALLTQSAFLLLVGLLLLLGYLFLAVRYWFRIPLLGIALASAFYVIALIVNVM